MLLFALASPGIVEGGGDRLLAGVTTMDHLADVFRDDFTTLSGFEGHRFIWLMVVELGEDEFEKQVKNKYHGSHQLKKQR